MISKHEGQLIRRAQEDREKFLYAADQVMLAVYHRRPPSEIRRLLEDQQRLFDKKFLHNAA